VRSRGCIATLGHMTARAKISCRGLWKIYGPDPVRALARHGGHPTAEALAREGYIGAVCDVSFDAAEGEILVVMGLSGSGKSTLVRCLSRLIEPTAGQVLFDGQDITQAGPRELIELRRHKMGMVFQNFGLLPHRSALRNVTFPLEVQARPRSQREARGAELLKLVGLDGREGYFPRELSGGQQQRVGIALSLAVEPDVWFLDEPFSALDPLIRREMQDEFLRLQRMLRKTIVFITHDFDEAIRLADRIGIMRDGALIQLGTPEEIVTQPVDSYVAAFTRNAPKARLIRARTAMEPLAGTPPARTVPAEARIAEIAPVVLDGDGPVAVVADDGAAIGQLTRRRVIEILFGEGAAA
jgi:glycine betaine/proline transport system ATP-binding protein